MFNFKTVHRVVSGAALLISTFSTAVWAQSANEPALTIEGLSGGTVVEQPERAVGDTYIKETFSSWALRCIVAANGEDPCQMYQLLEDAQGTPIAEFSLFRLPEGAEAAAGATIVVPLETALEAGLTVQVDDKPAKRYPFAFCNTIGCYARVALTPEEVENFKTGAEAIMSIVPVAAPDQRVRVRASLSGFTAAFGEASVVNP